MHYIRPYLVALAVIIALDLLWLGLIMSGFYRAQLGHLLGPNVYWPAAILFYLLYVLGTVVFAIAPALAARSFNKALLLGGLFGFMAYMTYDLTNMATMRDWPLLVTVADMVWGTVLTAIAVSVAVTVELRLSTKEKASGTEVPLAPVEPAA